MASRVAYPKIFDNVSFFGIRIDEDAWVIRLPNLEFGYDPRFTNGVPNGTIEHQECESKNPPRQHHNWTQAEEENWGSVQTYVTIGVAGASEEIRGTWSSGFEVNPISWGYGEYGIEVPDLGNIV